MPGPDETLTVLLRQATHGEREALDGLRAVCVMQRNGKSG